MVSFQLIMQSGSVDILHKLEKRVVSRLNAHTLMPPALTTEDMCAEMHIQLTRSLEGDFQQFKQSVEGCFGVFDSSKAPGALSDWSAMKLALQRKGSLHDTLNRYISSGYSRRDFRTALSVCVGALTAANPNITAQKFLAALESQVYLQPMLVILHYASMCMSTVYMYEY
ncbi:hypothetical protein EON64_03370 [archaeon]|nr:MAG: hypothetical protein EON64_03370 [archaeon]